MGSAMSDSAFEGQTVWVVGASSGIGQAMAEVFNKFGAKVIVSARRAEKLDELVAKLKARNGPDAAALVFDATDVERAADHVERAVGVFGGVDVIVLCQGISNRGSVAETDLSVERRLFEVNFFSYLALTKAILPHFEARKSGRFVVMSSVQGFFGLPERAPYAASKHALHGYFDSLRCEVAHKGVRVNIVCPGYVRTELSLHALTKDAGSTNGKMDAATAAGFSPEFFANKALRGIYANNRYTVVAQRSAVFALWLNRYLPSVLARILQGRGRKLDRA